MLQLLNAFIFVSMSLKRGRDVSDVGCLAHCVLSRSRRSLLNLHFVAFHFLVGTKPSFGHKPFRPDVVETQRRKYRPARRKWKKKLSKSNIYCMHTQLITTRLPTKVILSILFLYFEIQNNLIFTIIFYSAEALNAYSISGHKQTGRQPSERHQQCWSIMRRKVGFLWSVDCDDHGAIAWQRLGVRHGRRRRQWQRLL